MTVTPELPIREDLRGRSPYGAPQLDVPHPLNTNENPFPPSAGLIADIASAVATSAARLNRYPDRDAVGLRADLAAYLGHGLDGSRVWAANGSNEVMLQLLQAFGGPGRTAMGFTPTYAMYPDYCRDTFTRYVTVPRDSDFAIDTAAAVSAIEDLRPTVVLVASPNNPTGTALPTETLKAICDVAPGIVIVDEAYGEFRRPGTPSALELLDSVPGLVVTRTMSKAFAMAGTRLGYFAASPAIVDAVQLVRLPYHLSTVTQTVARVALAHSGELLGGVSALRSARDECVDWLRGKGLRVADSDANFVFFGRFPDRHAVWQALLDRGVLIREVGPQGWLRVTIGTPADMAAFRAAMTEVLAGEALAAPPGAPEPPMPPQQHMPPKAPEQKAPEQKGTA